MRKAQHPSRRQFLNRMALGGAFFATAGAFAQQLVVTPSQTLGPHYPERMPLDRDNDLIILNDNITPALGEITWLSGRVLDQRGQPLRSALVEIWQADNNGAYIHTRSPISNRDSNFQGYGRFGTGSSGEYLFRTVKPGLYPGRTRHIHYQITVPGGQTLVAQCYVQGDPLNAADGVLNGIRDAAERQSVIVPFAPIADSCIGELEAKFDVIMGFTPAEECRRYWLRTASSTERATSRGSLQEPGSASSATTSHPQRESGTRPRSRAASCRRCWMA